MTLQFSSYYSSCTALMLRKFIPCGTVYGSLIDVLSTVKPPSDELRHRSGTKTGLGITTRLSTVQGTRDKVSESSMRPLIASLSSEFCARPLSIYPCQGVAFGRGRFSVSFSSPRTGTPVAESRMRSRTSRQPDPAALLPDHDTRRLQTYCFKIEEEL